MPPRPVAPAAPAPRAVSLAHPAGRHGHRRFRPIAASSALPADRYGHVIEGLRDRGLRLVHGDLRLRHAPVGQAGRSQAAGQRLDQPDRLAGDDGRQPSGQRAVVDGMRQVIGLRCRPGVRPYHGVDDELLAVAALVLEHAVPTADPQAAQLDPVQGHAGSPPPACGAARCPAGPPGSADSPGPETPSGPAIRQRAATRTASALAATACTRTHHAPAAAASAVSAMVASSEPANGRGVPSAAASRRPMKRFLDAPTSTGNCCPPPSTDISRSRVSSAQLCSGSFANPSPGSITIRAGSTPSLTAASTRLRSSAQTSLTTSPYLAMSCITALCPRQCTTTYGTPAASTRRRMAGSARPPLTSLTIFAPALSAISATAARIVSTLTVRPAPASSLITGPTRRSSSAAGIRFAPGLVDSPPTSMMSAPSVASRRPWEIAAPGAKHSPPSEKESGVTLTTPMTRHLPRSGRPPAAGPAARPCPGSTAPDPVAVGASPVMGANLRPTRRAGTAARRAAAAASCSAPASAPSAVSSGSARRGTPLPPAPPGRSAAYPWYSGRP